MPSALDHLAELRRRLDLDLDLDLQARGPVRKPRWMLVSVARTEGSAPREQGAWMAVGPDAVVNTLGGGRLEHEAIALARERLAAGAPQTERRFALGPSLGQCCGGAVRLRFEPLSGPLDAQTAERLAPAPPPVALFGGGHVGRALVHVLGTLPMRVRWIDSRDEIFPEGLPANVSVEHSDPVARAVDDLEPGTRVLVMSFSHAEDLDVVHACLRRRLRLDDLPFVGLIGSATKRATFARRLRERGHADGAIDRIVCPIGLAGIPGKAPEVIAVAVAAQLLLDIEAASPRVSADGSPGREGTILRPVQEP